MSCRTTPLTGKPIKLPAQADIRRRMLESKGGHCEECGFDKYPEALHFHHLDPAQKDEDWKNVCRWEWEEIVVEMDKCIVLCANCHAHAHGGTAWKSVPSSPHPHPPVPAAPEPESPVDMDVEVREGYRILNSWAMAHITGFTQPEIMDFCARRQIKSWKCGDSDYRGLATELECFLETISAAGVTPHRSTLKQEERRCKRLLDSIASKARGMTQDLGLLQDRAFRPA